MTVSGSSWILRVTLSFAIGDNAHLKSFTRYKGVEFNNFAYCGAYPLEDVVSQVISSLSSLFCLIPIQSPTEPSR